MMGQMPKSANAGGNALVYNFFGEGSTDTADKDIDNFGLQFVIRVDRDGAEGPAAALLILDRLHGDAVFQANNVPTYGLHRHQLVITGGTGETHAVTATDRIGDRGERVSDAEAMMVAHYRLSIAATSAAPFALHGGRAV